MFSTIYFFQWLNCKISYLQAIHKIQARAELGNNHIQFFTKYSSPEVGQTPIWSTNTVCPGFLTQAFTSLKCPENLKMSIAVQKGLDTPNSLTLMQLLLQAIGWQILKFLWSQVSAQDTQLNLMRSAVSSFNSSNKIMRSKWKLSQ